MSVPVNTLRLVMAQISLRVGDVDSNVAQVLAAAAKAQQRWQADMLIFPELTLSGYPPEDLLLRQDFLDKIDAGLAQICAANLTMDLLLGYPCRHAGSLYNAAAVIRNGCVVARYFKQCLPNYGVFDERRYFHPGEQACVVECKGVPLGISLCEDLWSAEPAHQLKKQGATVLLSLNASPFHRHKAKDRDAIVRARAQETGLPVVYLNLVGGQDELVFDGGSFVMAANGRVTQQAPLFEEGLFPVELDLKKDSGNLQPKAAVIIPQPSEEARVYQALLVGVRDYVTKNGFPGALLGLSGGIDSALCLAIAVDALGADRVEAVLMPSPYTAAMSIEDAKAQADTMGAAHRLISIEPVFSAFCSLLAQDLAGRPADQTEENIQARCRGILLMALSNKTGRILLTTGNKSEMAVGYATLYGDMAGGFAPIKDVPKLWVYRLAHYRNSLSPVIPQRVIDRPPSAELAPDQKDSDSLPPYEILDAILENYIEQDLDIASIVQKGFDLATVRRIAALVHRNEHKRRQAPLGVRISKKAFGRDRRYPISSGFGFS